jgi:putative peptidoglycan lipid II flippase
MGIAVPRDTADSSRSEQELQLIPGASISDGRYRLLVFHGGPEHLQFWQALDTALDRQVALTFVDPDGQLSTDEVQDILTRTLRLSRISAPGIARVLDVARAQTGGLVVSEWIRGGSLQEVADTSPSPLGGARAMQSLAAAAEAAHRAGVALSVDHPSRVRVSIEGDVVLAFPATIPGATSDDDLRGIGAALYALLVNRWPLPETGEHSGLRPAELDAAGNPVEPKAINHDIPFQISAAAVRSVQRTGGIATATTLSSVLQQATAEADRTDYIAPIEAPIPTSPPRSRAKGPRGAPAELDEEQRARKRRGLLIGLGVVGAVVVVATLLAAALFNGFNDDFTSTQDKLGLNPSTSASAPAGPGNAVKPIRATVFSPGGGPDNPGSAELAIDGNSSTGWSTDVYHDSAPFPNFKNGVGLMLQLPQPTKLSAVTLNVSSTGTQIQIRSANSESPGSLDDTTAITGPTPVQPGQNRIPVTMSSPTSYVLVWISTLGKTNGESKSEISEITLEGSS